MSRFLLVGLTGGVAAGKSTVARMLEELGGRVLDADQLAREVTPSLREPIVAAFGAAVLDAAGEIDRERLGRVVFSDPGARKRLEAITHPAIIAAARARVERLRQEGRSPVIYEAALLLETGRHREMDLTVVVVADDELRLARLMQRAGLSRAEAEARLSAQLPQADKAAQADFVIDNSGPLEQTRARVGEVWREIQRRMTCPEEES